MNIENSIYHNFIVGGMSMWKWEAEGQPKAIVVIVHNVYEHHQRYAWLIQQLRNNGFHVVMGDLPGHGSNITKPFHSESFHSYEEHVKSLISVGLQDNYPLFILGHGIGATLVFRLLQKEKIECAGVIASSPWLSLSYQPSKLTNVLTKINSAMKLDHEIDIGLLTRNSSYFEQFKDDSHYKTTVTAAWFNEMQALMKAVLQSERTIFNVPLLIHTAENDKITYTDVTKLWLNKQDLSEYQFKEWKHLYHDVYHEPEREELYLYTQSFMNNVLRSLGYIV